MSSALPDFWPMRIQKKDAALKPCTLVAGVYSLITYIPVLVSMINFGFHRRFLLDKSKVSPLQVKKVNFKKYEIASL